MTVILETFPIWPGMLLAKCAATRELALNLHHFFGIRKVLNQIFLEPVLCSLEILLIWPWDQSGCQKLGDHGTWKGRVFSERKDPPTYIILSLFTCYLQYQRRAFNTSQPVGELSMLILRLVVVVVQNFFPIKDLSVSYVCFLRYSFNSFSVWSMS